VQKEGKGKENYISLLSLNYRNLNQNAADCLFGSNRQANFGYRRLRRWKPGRESELECGMY
jgi:hypothetical protein